MAENSRRFVSELSEALRRGLEQGELTDEDLDALLHSSDFEAGAFDLFLAEARRQSVKLPEGSRMGDVSTTETTGHSSSLISWTWPSTPSTSVTHGSSSPPDANSCERVSRR